MNGQSIWFHGTHYRAALKIEREGFRPGTWFARHMEDAVEFGGACVFWVKVKFDKTPMKWQVCCTNKLPASTIIRRLDVVRPRDRRSLRPSWAAQAKGEVSQ